MKVDDTKWWVSYSENLFYSRALRCFTIFSRLPISSSGMALSRRPSSRSPPPLRDAWTPTPEQGGANIGSLSVGCTLRCALRLRFRRWPTKQPIRRCSTTSARRRKSLCRKYTKSSLLLLVACLSPTAHSHTSPKTRTKRRGRGLVLLDSPINSSVQRWGCPPWASR